MRITKIVILMLVAQLTLLWSPSASPALDVGDKAPLFVGNSTQGTIALADYQGKKNVVLALYFAVFTPV